jgi:hypothetical protein
MGRAHTSYFSATRHPWACLVFILPLLAAYEGGVLWLGSTDPSALRNGADTWLRWALDALGLRQLYWAPVMLAAFLVGWSWLRRRDRPTDMLGVWIGMAIESAVFAVGLWALSLGLAPFLDRLGVQLTSAQQIEPAFEQAITFLGAGIYEEVLFRLLLFAGLVWLLRSAAVGKPLALLLASVTSATVFSSAHHLGPYGEPFNNFVFLFRTLAGLYFTVVFSLRGFGITVGAHAFYDVLVGIIVPCFWHAP